MPSWGWIPHEMRRRKALSLLLKKRQSSSPLLLLSSLQPAHAPASATQAMERIQIFVSFVIEVFS